MCGRYVLVQKIEVIEKRFNVTAPSHFEFEPNYNITPGQLAPIITAEDPRVLQLFRFGMTPHWSKKNMILFNARVEGDRNQENDPTYSGSKDIISKPAFRKSIRSQRCLVIADAFIEGTTKEGLDKPFVVFLKDKVRPFAFAGIYDVWLNPETGTEVFSFSIITTTANDLIQRIPHHRSPIILYPHQEAAWLNLKTPLTDITRMLNSYPSEKMNAYPISSKIKNPKANEASLLEPIGSELNSISELSVDRELKLQGMGSRKKSIP